MEKPDKYIVFAIWGASPECQLDEHQKAINNMIKPVIQEVLESLKIQLLPPELRFSFEYFCRGYIILNLMLFVQKSKNKLERHKIFRIAADTVSMN